VTETILLTGGLGFIGSHISLSLLEAGYKVVIVDNLSNSRLEVLDYIDEITCKKPIFHQGDIRDSSFIRDIFLKYKFDGVIHLAGLKSVVESALDPLLYFDNNVVGTIRILEAMKSFSVKKFIFSSSATVYGLPQYLPIKEDHPLSATNPYGSSKLIIESILKDFFSSNVDWSIICLRYFNPIGAHPSGLIGENSLGKPNNLMPYINLVASNELSNLNIYGDDYQTIDGTGVRDYIHIMDLVDGHIKALQYSFACKGFEAFNLGTGKGTSVLELVKAYEIANGIVIPYKIQPRRLGDVDEVYADPSYANKILGFSCQKGLIEMCQDSWRYVLNKTLDN